MKTQIIAGLQKSTGEIIYSRAHHDYVSTTDGGGFLDGGQTGPYIRHSGVKIIIIELDVSAGELYDDWNYSRNKYGRILPEDAKSVKIVPKEEIMDRASFEFRKHTATWGTYGINGDQPRQEKNLVLCDTDHLLAILRTQGHASAEIKAIIASILLDREIDKIDKQDEEIDKCLAKLKDKNPEIYDQVINGRIFK